MGLHSCSLTVHRGAWRLCGQKIGSGLDLALMWTKESRQWSEECTGSHREPETIERALPAARNGG